MITRNIQSQGIQYQAKFNSSNSYSQSQSQSHSPYQKFQYSPDNKSYQHAVGGGITSNFKRYTITSNQKNSNFKRTQQQNYIRKDYERQSENDKPQYELLLEYELKREQQKNKILNQRLKNKEEFINEIKTIQEQLTKAYSKCQQQLNQANSRLFQLQNYQIRNYVEEIQDLKHKVKQYQSQISKSVYKLPQKRPLKSKSNIILKNNNRSNNNEMSFSNNYKDKDSLLINQQKRIKSQYQTKNVGYDLKKIKEEATGKILKLNSFNSPKVYHSSTGNLPIFVNENQKHKQSVYLMNAHQLPKQAKPQDAFEQEILFNLHKVANFIRHFMQMSKIYVKIDDEGSKMTHKLKSCWRWIKEVVRQWNKLKQNEKQYHANPNTNTNFDENQRKKVQQKQDYIANKQQNEQMRKKQNFNQLNSLENREDSLKQSQIMHLNSQKFAQIQAIRN